MQPVRRLVYLHILFWLFSILTCYYHLDEIALYDRQIRLWGMAAQARMRSAKVLLINLGAVGSEIAKNIVLSGIGSLTILDAHNLTEEDLGAQFFVGFEDLGKKRVEAALAQIQDLNPRVKLDIDSAAFVDKEAKFFQAFDLIIATDLSPADIRQLNTHTRNSNIPLYIAGLNGLSAYIFVDLVEFVSVDEKIKSSIPIKLGMSSPNKEIVHVSERVDEEKGTTYQVISTKHIFKPFDETITKSYLGGQLSRRQIKRITNPIPLTFAVLNYEIFTSIELSDFEEKAKQCCKQLGLPVENLKPECFERFLEQVNVEISPVAAVIGGAVSQDVINILGKRQSPLNNFVVFDGITLDMWIFEL